MREIAYVIDNGYLSHSGILGMKWGQKNGPPYPIREGGHSAAEVKANPKLAGGGLSSRSIKKMSDDELRTRIARNKLEDEYRKSLGKRTKAEKHDLRLTAAKNLRGLVSGDSLKATIDLGKDILDNTVFLGPRIWLTVLSSKAFSSAISAGKDALNVWTKGKEHDWKISEMITEAKYKGIKGKDEKKQKKNDDDDD